MTWCENNGIDYIFGLSGTRPLAKKVDEVADDIRTRRAIENLAVLRGYTETRHKAKSWDRERRTVARIEATMLGLDIRFVVTSLDVGSAEWIYDSLYCARGQAENLIKLHKTQLASDRTSCRSALANQVRLVLHTAAYWLMLTVRSSSITAAFLLPWNADEKSYRFGFFSGWGGCFRCYQFPTQGKLVGRNPTQRPMRWWPNSAP